MYVASSLPEPDAESPEVSPRLPWEALDRLPALGESPDSEFPNDTNNGYFAP